MDAEHRRSQWLPVKFSLHAGKVGHSYGEEWGWMMGYRDM